MSKKYSDGYLQKLWRQAVLKEYNYMCANCGLAGAENLECHHIIKRRNKIFRHDWRNGITGCKECHRFYDSLEGIEFIKSIHGYYELLKENENKPFKQYLMDNGIIEKEFLQLRRDELKLRIKGG